MALSTSHESLFAAVKMPRTKIPARAFRLTAKNIGAALYEINKAAKRERDRARKAQQWHSKNARLKDAYYSIKSAVIEKAEREKLAAFAGYHLVEHGHSRMYACYEIGGLRFHALSSCRLGGHINLGQWESAAKQAGTKMRMCDAILTLRSYLAKSVSKAQCDKWNRVRRIRERQLKEERREEEFQTRAAEEQARAAAEECQRSLEEKNRNRAEARRARTAIENLLQRVGEPEFYLGDHTIACKHGSLVARREPADRGTECARLLLARTTFSDHIAMAKEHSKLDEFLRRWGIGERFYTKMDRNSFQEAFYRELLDKLDAN